VLPMLTLRAGLAMWQGRHPDARAAVQRGLTETRSDDLVLLGVLAWHGLRAEAEAHVAGAPTDPGAIRRLTTVVDRIEAGIANAASQVRTILDGYLELCAAELNRLGDRPDPEPWSRAAQIWDQVQQPYPAAYARLRQAEAALQRKVRRPAAITALREAYATATMMGARPFAAEIVNVAHKFRVALADDADTIPMRAPDPAMPTLNGGDELGVLTIRERQVLAAVAEGLTNREIGELLFISERTVGVHVGHIFDKLQVRTRVQASRVFLTAA
jgi:DNA-binding CsgD family transcriptional regulator